MTEQRRDAQRGSVGLGQSWQGVIARARLRGRYMSLYCRLLTAGMRPPAPSTPAAAAAPTSTPTLPRHSSDEGAQGMSRRRTAPTFVPPSSGTTGPPPASPALRRSLSAKEMEQLETPSQRPRLSGSSDARVQHGSRGGPGGSPAELHRLAGQIRNPGGKAAVVPRKYSSEVQRELQVRWGGGVSLGTQ